MNNNAELSTYIAVLDVLKQQINEPKASLEQIATFVQSTEEREQLAESIMSSLESRPDFKVLFPDSIQDRAVYIREVLDTLTTMDISETIAQETIAKEQLFKKIEQEPETKTLLARAMQKVADGFAVVKRHKWKILAGLSLAAGFAIWYYWEYLLGLGIRFKEGWQNFVPGTETERNAIALKNALDVYNQSHSALEMIGVDHTILFNGVSYSNLIPGQMESLKVLLQEMRNSIPNISVIFNQNETSRASTESAIKILCESIGIDFHLVKKY